MALIIVVVVARRHVRRIATTRVFRKVQGAMKQAHGFSLIEMMVAMALFGIAITGIYQTYHYQQQVHLKQQQIVDMQQEARAADFFLSYDIRMAGYDPAGNAEPVFNIARIAEFQFEADLNGDGDLEGDAGEIIRWALTNDANRNGISDAIDGGGAPPAVWKDDSSACGLGREYITRNGGVDTGGGLQPVANNVQALEFCYVLDDGSVTTAPTAAEALRVRSVYVSMLHRTGGKVRHHRNTQTYVPASRRDDLTPAWVLSGSSARPNADWGPFDDGYHRTLTVMKIRCRNLGANPYAD
jgi:type IV pilus assembly protein PilW